MNAPSPFIFLQIHLLEPSPTNPRKRFDPKKLEELASSIQTQGILQPILVRPYPDTSGRGASGKVEIIAGERRWRAAQLAGLNDVPCLVRDLTDQQVLHAQVIENLQRDDLHELEEAEGYERLLKEKNAQGKPYTVEAIAEEVGKSKRYVYARIQLLDLCEEARQACFDGKISASTALLIAAIPVQKLQLEAVADVIEDEDGGQYEMSYREARDHIRNKFMTDLAKAPFDIQDAKLLAKVGSCTECTRRTGNQPGLFDAIDSADVCTNTSCYAMKKAAHILAVQNEAEKHGHIVIKGEEAKKHIRNKWDTGSFFWNNKFTDLDDEIRDDPENRTWRQVLDQHQALKPDARTGKPPVQKTVIENPHQPGVILEGINIEQTTQALREMGFVIERKEAKLAIPGASWPFPERAPKQKTPEQLAKEAENTARIESENAYRLALFQACGERIGAGIDAGAHPGLLLMLAERFWHESYYDGDVEKQLAAKYFPGEEVTWEEMKDRLAALTPQQHLQLVFDLIMADELSIGYYDEDEKPDNMLHIAGVLAVDPAPIRAEHEYKAPEAAPAEVKKGGKKAKKGGAE